MRRHIRTLLILALAIGLIALFLRAVDLRVVAREIRHADPMWLAISFASMFVNLVIRSLRWRYLLEPIGKTSFANAFRATAVGFAARGVLPSAAGELVRPYFHFVSRGKIVAKNKQEMEMYFAEALPQ